LRNVAGAFDIEQIGVHQEVDHRLEVVRVRAADIGGYQDTVTLALNPIWPL
jgi:hypothetical protein